MLYLYHWEVLKRSNHSPIFDVAQNSCSGSSGHGQTAWRRLDHTHWRFRIIMSKEDYHILPVRRAFLRPSLSSCKIQCPELPQFLIYRARSQLYSVYSDLFKHRNITYEPWPFSFRIGGAKLCDILHSRLEKIFADCEPCKLYSTDEVVIALRQSNGLKPPFFVSEVAFETLVKPLIEKMEMPALACVDSVKTEMANMCQLSIPDQMKSRFPEMKQALVQVVQSIVDTRAQRAIQMVRV